MKRIVAGIVCISILIAIGLFVFSHQRSIPKNPTPSPTPPAVQVKTTSLPAQAGPSKTITYGDQTYAYDIIKTRAPTIFLIPNFIQKTSFQSIIESSGCVAGTNGGFYDTQNKPLGYFVTDSYTHNQIQSALFNGYFIISNDNKASILSSLITDGLRVGLQSGPLLFIDNHMQTLRIQNDEHARRIVAAVTNDGTVLFVVLYTQEPSFNGPKLADLPSLIDALNTKESLHIVNALNLDGGSASAFYSNTLQLSELTVVGSVFCIK